MPSDYVSLLQETITRLEGRVPRVYTEQCQAMVRQFLYVRDSLSSLLRGKPYDEYSSKAIFQELHRLACEAERVLTGFCDEQRWLQAVVFTDVVFTDPKWSIFEMLGTELSWCFEILREKCSDAERLKEPEREEIFKADQKKLIEQLEVLKNTGTTGAALIAKFILARLGNADETGDALRCWSSNRGVMKRFLTSLLPRHCIVTPEYTAVDFNVFMITDRVEGVKPVIASVHRTSHSIVTRNLEWAGVSPVAVKAFIEISDSTDRRRGDIRREWTKEVCIMANLNHPNVARFIGCTSQGDGYGPAILMESEDMSLQQLIKRLRKKEEEYRKSQSPASQREQAVPLLPLHVAVDILLQFASGMVYLHDQDLAHLDLKLANLLVSSSEKPLNFLVRNPDYVFRVKIADFGNSICLKGLQGKIRNPFDNNHGTTIYRAPELFNGRRKRVCMKAADVCSFAFTCWAILHCEEPTLPGLSKGSDYRDAIVSGIRLGFHESIPEELRDLIKCCWRTNPDSRPRFSEIYFFLQSYKGKLLGSQSPLAPFQNTHWQKSSEDFDNLESIDEDPLH